MKNITTAKPTKVMFVTLVDLAEDNVGIEVKDGDFVVSRQILGTVGFSAQKGSETYEKIVKILKEQEKTDKGADANFFLAKIPF